MNSSLQRISLNIFLLAFVIAVMVLAKTLLIPLTIAVFFTFLLLPFSRFLERKKFARWLATLVSLSAAILIIGSLLYFFYLQLEGFSRDWPKLKESVVTKMDAMYHYVHQQFNISEEDQELWLKERMNKAIDSGDKIAFYVFTAVEEFLASLILIPILVFFITLYRKKIKIFFTLVFKHEHVRILPLLDKVAAVSQAYLKGIFLDVFILSVLNSIGFLLFDLHYAVLFGILAGILNVMPYIGVMVGSILPFAMALLTHNEISYALGVMGTCVVVQFLDNNFITPYVVGRSVSINPLAAIIALLLSALIWGVAGMILCIPLLGMIKVVCDNIEELKPYGYLIGEEDEYKKIKQA